MLARVSRTLEVVILSAACLAGCQGFFGVSETEAKPDAQGGGVECGDTVCSPSEDCLSCPDDCARPSCADPYEPNNESLEATDLQLDARVCDLGLCAGEEDWFSVKVPPAARVQIEYDPSLGDLDLEVYDPIYYDGSYEPTGLEEVVIDDQGEFAARVYGAGDDPSIKNRCYCIRISSQ